MIFEVIFPSRSPRGCAFVAEVAASTAIAAIAEAAKQLTGVGEHLTDYAAPMARRLKEAA